MRLRSVRGAFAVVAVCLLVVASTCEVETMSDNTLSENLQKAIEDESVRERITISLQVNGGLASERYQLFLEASGRGSVEYEYRSQLLDDTLRSGTADISDEAFVALLKQVRVSGVLGLSQEDPRFVPDTVIGILEISDGENSFRATFAADPEQAEEQGRTPPPEVTEAADAMYALGARVMDLESVKP